MKAALAILGLYMFLPYVGLYTVSDAILDVYNLSKNSAYELRFAYLSYLICFVVFFKLGQKVAVTGKTRGAPKSLSDKDLRQLRRFLTLYLIISAVVVYLWIGHKLISGDMHRGEMRVSFGGLGFLYKAVTQYWTPVALAMSGVAYQHAKSSNQKYAFPWLHLVLTILILAMMGYKSGVIVGILPFLFVITSNMNWHQNFFVLFLIVVLLTGYSYLVMDFENVLRVFAYLFIRATEGTSWGLIATWETFEWPHSDAWLVLTPVFGPRITANLIGIDTGTVEYLKLGSGQYVTYLVHPNRDLVLLGQTNLTITLAGEAIYLFGQKLFWLVAIPVGFITGIVFKSFRAAIQENSLFWAPLLAVLITTILIPLINSGGIVSLYSAFNLFYMSTTVIFIKCMRRIHI